MKDRKNFFTHSFFYTATVKPPHQYPGAEVKPGFTLVELMVVMSIIAMLLGILIPAMSAARRTAYRTMCKENLHSCALAFKMYLDDNRNTMPVIYNMPNSTKQDDPNSVSLYGAIGKYLGARGALKCPADRWPEKNSSYFQEEGSSYEYNNSLKGQRIEDLWVAKKFGLMEVWILHDYDGFHGKKNVRSGEITYDERNNAGTTEYSLGSFTYLFADTLVGDRTRDK